MQTKCVILGGFLGAGKTTTLVASANLLEARGYRVMMVVNDQGYELVDTKTAQLNGTTVAEVGGGCFCCKFQDLEHILKTKVAVEKPDFILCEPVGSCTDLNATVIRPMRSLFGTGLAIAPLAVVVDPDRLTQCLAMDMASFNVNPVGYIMWKQMEESDVLVVNKADLYPSDHLSDIVARLKKVFPQKIVLQCSARQAESLNVLIHTWMNGEKPERDDPYDLDYDLYTAGEARLAWLNVSGMVTKNYGGSFHPIEWMSVFYGAAQQLFTGGATCRIAHLKVMLYGPAGHIKASLVGNEQETVIDQLGDFDLAFDVPVLINARVESTPVQLERVVNLSIQRANQSCKTMFLPCYMESFSPSRPEPTYRMEKAVDARKVR